MARRINALITGLALAITSGLAAAGNPIEVTDVAVNVVPECIPCGGTATVTIAITMYIDPDEDLPPVHEQNNWVKLYENDNMWNDGADYLDDLLASHPQGYKVSPGDIFPNNTAFKTFVFEIGCDPKSNGKCAFWGRPDVGAGPKGYDPDGTGKHQIFIEAGHTWGAKESRVVDVKCVNTNGGASPSDCDADEGESTTCEGRLELIDADVANVEWNIQYDPTWIMVNNAMFEPGVQPFFAFTDVDLSMPGMVRFTATSPVNLPPGILDGPPLWLIGFQVLPGAPPGEYEIITTTDSVFTDQFLTPLGVHLGDSLLTVAINDTTLPVIDIELVSMDLVGDTVIGGPGAVTDAGLSGPGDVIAFLTEDPPGLVDPATFGRAIVNPDGSFVLDEVVLHHVKENVRLHVVDTRGNTTITDLTIECAWSDGFELYADGSDAHNQGDWRGWDNDPAFSAPVTSAQARSSSKSIDVFGDADLIHRHCIDPGAWSYTAWQYIPSNFESGGNGQFDGSYFILLNTYNHGGPYHRSVQLQFDSNDGLCKVFHGDGTDTIPVPYDTDRWVKIQVIADQADDWTQIYYDDELITEYPWTGGVIGDGGGALDIAAVDLFAAESTSVYYDDLKLERIEAGCGSNNIQSDFDIDGLDLGGETAAGTDPCDPDTDDDDWLDGEDNCPGEFNPGQEDGDLDGVGDACDGVVDCPFDFDGDTVVGVTDLLELLAAWGTPDATYDLVPAGGDGDVGVPDLLALLSMWGGCP